MAATPWAWTGPRPRPTTAGCQGVDALGARGLGRLGRRVLGLQGLQLATHGGQASALAADGGGGEVDTASWARTGVAAPASIKPAAAQARAVAAPDLVRRR
jgi:hypothetical protein